MYKLVIVWSHEDASEVHKFETIRDAREKLNEITSHLNLMRIGGGTAGALLCDRVNAFVATYSILDTNVRYEN